MLKIFFRRQVTSCWLRLAGGPGPHGLLFGPPLLRLCLSGARPWWSVKCPSPMGG